MKAWQGRFKDSTHVLMEAFNESITFDQQMIDQDISGSIAHVKMLNKIGILTIEEKNLIIENLLDIQKDYHLGQITFSASDEDIHMGIENILTQRIGDIAKKMHTGRSRNDQVATDLRLYAVEAVRDIKILLLDMIIVMKSLSEDHLDVIMPGFTHLQKAQPISLAFYLNAYMHMFKRDYERLDDALKRIKILPLGSGALAGTNYESDRAYMTELLNFDAFSMNGLDAISDRDFVIELQSVLSMMIMHFSRLSEDFIIWNSENYNYISLSDQFATGSSLMPQKKNPDACELTRGKTGRIFGHLMSILTVMKGLPMSYNKDMQEDKEGLFDSVYTIKEVLKVNTEMLKTLTFNTEQMKKDLVSGYLNATDLADYLVKKQIPFRQAHHIVGSMVKFAQDKDLPLECLELDEMKNFSEVIDGDVYKALLSSTDGKLSKGSTNKASILFDINCFEKWIEDESK